MRAIDMSSTQQKILHCTGAPIGRRRAVTIIAGAAGMSLIGAVARADTGEFHLWRGAALGAEASLTLWHPDPAKAQRMVGMSLKEIARLEKIFSLFQPDSELARLNRDGTLSQPSKDLRLLLEQSQRMGTLSGGAFDITVQPFWDLYAAHFGANPNMEHGPDPRHIEVARALVDYRAIDVSSGHVAFARPGMAATMNGIAQGYIADRIADMMRDDGFDQVVVELGEIRALGNHPNGRPWRVGIKDPLAPLQIARMIDVSDQAVATSGGYGTGFDPSGHHHHIFDPTTGASARRYLDVTVVGLRAMVADALSTALFVAPEARAVSLVRSFPGVYALITDLDGGVRVIEG